MRFFYSSNWNYYSNKTKYEKMKILLKTVKKYYACTSSGTKMKNIQKKSYWNTLHISSLAFNHHSDVKKASFASAVLYNE